MITVFEQLQSLGKAEDVRRPRLPERAGAERAERGQHARATPRSCASARSCAS
ncbi:MAG: hypothetical protein MZV65_14550 [Chromatiales bacterium]|nr:hypothetical protein [Chromatiales bacterium]